MREVLAVFYRSDAAVAGDPELQAWGDELGLPVDGWLLGRVPKFYHSCERSLLTFDSLTLVLSHVIFTCTCQHSVLNNNQYAFGGFVPASPMAFWRPLEPLFGEDTELHLKDLLLALPARFKANQQVAFAWFLSSSSPCPVLLDFTNPVLEADDRTRDAVARFQRRLRDVAGEISQRIRDRRDEGHCIEYTFASPETCNVSIGI